VSNDEQRRRPANGTYLPIAGADALPALGGYDCMDRIDGNLLCLAPPDRVGEADLTLLVWPTVTGRYASSA
jgi:hypothetical protein